MLHLKEFKYSVQDGLYDIEIFIDSIKKCNVNKLEHYILIEYVLSEIFNVEYSNEILNKTISQNIATEYFKKILNKINIITLFYKDDIVALENDDILVTNLINTIF